MQYKKRFLKVCLVLGDLILMYGSLILILILRRGEVSFLLEARTKIILFHFSFIYLFWFFYLFIFDFYGISPLKKHFDFFYNLITFSFLSGATGIIYFYLRPEIIITPKTILAGNILIFSIFLCVFRYFVSQILKFRNLREKIIVLGFQSELKELVPELLAQNNYEIVAFFNPDSSFVNELESVASLAKQEVISDIHQLGKVIEKEKVNSVVFALDFHKNTRLAQQLFSNLSLNLNYINFSDFYESLTKKIPIETIDETWFLENFSQAKGKLNQILKRTFDIVLSSSGLLIALILFPFIALAIKIDSPGTVFYNQKRIGKEKRLFVFYKFRTMVENPNQDKRLWRERDVSQITKVGRFLRKTHFDELPQLWNILKGDLSFVGPRPERIELAELLEKKFPFYSQRHLIRPGFTGWAQLNFLSPTSFGGAKKKFQYDLYYIKNHSFLLDLGIILKTIKIIFKK